MSSSNLTWLLSRYPYILHLTSIKLFIHRLSYGNQKFSKLEVQKRGITLERFVKKWSSSNLTWLLLRYPYILHLTSIRLFIHRLSYWNEKFSKLEVLKKGIPGKICQKIVFIKVDLDIHMIPIYTTPSFNPTFCLQHIILTPIQNGSTDETTI